MLKLELTINFLFTLLYVTRCQLHAIFKTFINFINSRQSYRRHGMENVYIDFELGF